MVEDLVVGEVVKLKSGGEAMTVEKIDGDDIHCVWFEGKRAQRESFSAGVLKKYVRPSPSIRVLG